MNKEEFAAVLQVALLSFDGVCFVELINDHKFPKEISEAGIKLCEYLKSIKLENKTTLTTP